MLTKFSRRSSVIACAVVARLNAAASAALVIDVRPVSVNGGGSVTGPKSVLVVAGSVVNFEAYARRRG